RSLGLQPLAPQHKGIFDRFGVVATPNSGHHKPEPFIQEPRGFIRPADLEGRPLRPERLPFPQHVREQCRRNARAAMAWDDGEVVDVQLVHHLPERAEPDRRAVRSPRQKTERDAAILELRLVHRTRPRIGKRQFLDREDVVDLSRRDERFDLPDCHTITTKDTKDTKVKSCWFFPWCPSCPLW